MTEESARCRLHIDPVAALATITLARPSRGNALDPTMVAQLSQALDDAVAAGARLVALRGGEGPHFCTGFDLGALDRITDGDLLLQFVRVEQLLQKIQALPIATLAVAQGRAMGAGADIFTVCDHRLALAGATFAFPGPGFGLVLGNRRLAARIGPDRARTLLAGGASIAADEAAAWGLVSAVVTEGEAADRLAATAQAASTLDPLTLHAVREATANRDDDADLAALVRSAARPGLRDRIVAYRARLRLSP